MTALPADLIARRPATGVILDAGLLLLLFVGQIDTQLIARYKRTSNYTIEDWEMLITLIEHFGRPLTTPHILTEASNLAKSLWGSSQRQFYTEVAAWLLGDSTEIEIQSRAICSLDPAVIARFGVTDCVTIIAASSHLVVTDDGPLAMELERRSLDVVDFKQLRRELCNDQ